MTQRWNELQWDGQPGHYEVYYLTLTDHGTGVGFWIRYTMVAPLAETGEPATCSLWFLAMDPLAPDANAALKSTHPAEQLSSTAAPFELRVADGWLRDDGAAGVMDQGGIRVTWDLSWTPSLPAYGHVHPVLRAARIAKTILFLPHPDVEISGSIEIGDRRIELAPGTRGGQAHLWGSKHADHWAWAHCNDFAGPDGEPRPGAFVDGVSVYVPRFGRMLGPNTPIVGRIGSADVLSRSPLAVLRNDSQFDLTGWTFTARTPRRKLEGTVSARVEDLLGVTYHDPDGDLAYCYNTEVASMKLDVFERSGPATAWRKVDELHSDGRAHFEFAQREPVEQVPLAIR
jgi:hypothetical protein